MNGALAGGDQAIWTAALPGKAKMSSMMINALIAAGAVSAIGYGWLTHLQNRNRRSRAGAGGDGGSSGSDSGSGDGFSLGSCYTSDCSGGASAPGSCASSDSGSSGGDCGGGGGGGD